MAFAELLATDLASVEHALLAGADRIELCAALEVGGVTPGIGMLREAVGLAEQGAGSTSSSADSSADSSAEVVALIRPRRGDFLLDGPRGLGLLSAEIKAACDAGASGVAVGVLTEAAEVDFAAIEALVEAAGGVKVTFHRAIDHARDPLGAAKRLASIGIARVLTSGAAPSALEGARAIQAMVMAVEGRLEVIAAGGVRGNNAREVLDATGAPAIHGSCSQWVVTPAAGENAGLVPMGSLPENGRSVLDRASAVAFVAAAHSFIA